MKKKILVVMLSVLLCLSACKEHKRIECYTCKQIKNCYKITYWSEYLEREEDFWFCSDKCEKITNDRLIRSGCHRK